MAMKISQAELARVANRAAGMQTRLQRAKSKVEKTTARAIHTLEVGVSAFGFGVLQGKTGGVEIVGVPLELLTGVGLNLAGYLGLGGRMSDHLHGLGDGALAAYLTTVGRGVGQKWGSGTGILESNRSAGSIGAGASGFSESEIQQAVAEAAMVAR